MRSVDDSCVQLEVAYLAVVPDPISLRDVEQALEEGNVYKSVAEVAAAVAKVFANAEKFNTGRDGADDRMPERICIQAACVCAASGLREYCCHFVLHSILAEKAAYDFLEIEAVVSLDMPEEAFRVGAPPRCGWDCIFAASIARAQPNE